MIYSEATKAQLQAEFDVVSKRFEACKAQNLKLNMARGKPSKIQLDIAGDVLKTVLESDDCFVDGVDVRNYGELTGLQCAKDYWADVLGCKSTQVFVGGTSSLNFMFDVISRAFSHGLLHSERPWSKEDVMIVISLLPSFLAQN